jgi:hypothetical protein
LCAAATTGVVFAPRRAVVGAPKVLHDISNFGIATGALVSERDDWEAAVARAVAEGWRFLELTAMTEDQLDALAGFLERAPEELARFERVSLHAPVARLHSSTAVLADKVASIGWEFDTVFHPDLYGNTPSLRRLEQRLIFENMDNQKRFGRGVDDLRRVFDGFPEAGFCLDVAHVWTNDPSLELGHELIDCFGERLRQLHVSGIEPDGTHRCTTSSDLQLYDSLLARCEHVPWLLEAEATD